MSKNSVMNKHKNIAIALILTLTIFTALVSIVPSATAQKITTYAYLSIIPETQEFGKSVLINAWVSPPPLMIPGTMAGEPRTGYMITITKPDDSTETLGPFTSDGPGTMWTLYMADSIGTYSAKFSWAGDDNFEGIESQSVTFTVQQDPVPTYPAAELPTEYWERPISAENREWDQISGGWLMGGFSQGTGYNGSGSNFNPYTTGPESSHILWKKDTGIAGLVGGDYGSVFSSSGVSTPVIMLGRIYCVLGNNLCCVDLRTGQELWKVELPPGGQFSNYVGMPMVNGVTGWSQGGIWIVSYFGITLYDAYTGAVKQTFTQEPGTVIPSTAPAYTTAIENIPGTGQMYLYLIPGEGHIDDPFFNQILKWDATRAATLGGSFEDNIVWNINFTTVAPDHVVFINVVEDTVVASGYTLKFGFDKETGEEMWNATTIYQQIDGRTSGYGQIYYCSVDRSWRAYDVDTGEEMWTSEPAEYPWGAFWAYESVTAYGNIYAGAYDGYLYCYDADDGHTVWKYYSGDTPETPYGTWPMWGHPVVADGKIYDSTTEHSPTNPGFPRGFRLYALDAYNGDYIWSIAGSFSTVNIAEGTLLGLNDYNGILYAFDKGKTVTTVTASPKIIADGSSVLIEGTVMDLSPAQPNTPAISDEDMSEWMEYLHMQKPIPEEILGVDVSLDAIDPNGTCIHIDTVTSDMSGFYSYMWEPEDEGKYTIIATFEGSNSYWSSYAETAVGVGPAAAAGATFEPEPTAEPGAPLISTEVAIIAAVAVVAVIGIAAYWALKKRK